MKFFRRIFVIFIFSLIPLLCGAQAKVYTMKVKIADLPSRTTRVVISGERDFAKALRDGVFHYWRISPYEFCREEDYEKQNTDNTLYFLRPVNEEGIMMLSLSKGGVRKSDNTLFESFEIARIPLGENYDDFGALVDILQNFASDAMKSDRVGYAGLKYRNAAGARTIRKLLKTEPERIREVRAGRYSIVYDTLTHELLSYRK